MQHRAAYRRRPEPKAGKAYFQTVKSVETHVWYMGGEVIADKSQRIAGYVWYTVYMDRAGGCEGIGPFNRIELCEWANATLQI